MTGDPRDDGGESNATDNSSLDRTKLSHLKPIPAEINFWHIKLGNNRCHPSRTTIRKKDDLQCGNAESSMVPYESLKPNKQQHDTILIIWLWTLSGESLHPCVHYSLCECGVDSAQLWGWGWHASMLGDVRMVISFSCHERHLGEEKFTLKLRDMRMVMMARQPRPIQRGPEFSFQVGHWYAVPAVGRLGSGAFDGPASHTDVVFEM